MLRKWQRWLKAAQKLLVHNFFWSVLMELSTWIHGQPERCLACQTQLISVSPQARNFPSSQCETINQSRWLSASLTSMHKFANQMGACKSISRSDFKTFCPLPASTQNRACALFKLWIMNLWAPWVQGRANFHSHCLWTEFMVFSFRRAGGDGYVRVIHFFLTIAIDFY